MTVNGTTATAVAKGIATAVVLGAVVFGAAACKSHAGADSSTQVQGEKNSCHQNSCNANAKAPRQYK